MKPSLKQMLLVAKDIGLETIQEAFDNYMLHYDCFFLISNYREQLDELQNEIKSHNLTEIRDGQVWMKDMKVLDVLNTLGFN